MQKITNALKPVTLRPRGQTGLEAKIWLGTLNAEIKNSVMCCWHCPRVLIQKYLHVTLASTSKTWRHPQPHGSGLNLGFSLRVLASALVFWPHLISLTYTNNTRIPCN